MLTGITQEVTYIPPLTVHRNGHYGDVWGSLSLEELDDWLLRDAQPGAPMVHGADVPEGLSVALCDQSQVVSNVVRAIHIPVSAPPSRAGTAPSSPSKADQPAANASKAEEETKDETAVAGDSPPETVMDSVEPERACTPTPPETWEQIFKRARNFSIDIVPRVLFHLVALCSMG